MVARESQVRARVDLSRADKAKRTALDEVLEAPELGFKNVQYGGVSENDMGGTLPITRIIGL